ncbi:uncharacterized protein C8A04DRAFT_13859 [Dichotomopilus funicola]|uniref:DUF7896 domain-containing protein n=1 Tax=Dichotomopilus funicola TaxID=1934379 RepID=A0AAN6UYW9_9PEZI|nr:hypothetical protein C8A04DRAFT_13859 [Dichotomopilus funicola]
MSQPSQPLELELRAAIEKNEQEKLALMEQYETVLRRSHSDQSRQMKRAKTTHDGVPTSTAPMARSKSTMMPSRPIATSFVPNGQSLTVPPSPISVPGSAGGYLSQTAPAPFIPAPPPFHLPNFAPGPGFVPGPVPQGGLGRELGVDEYLSMQEDGMLSGISPIDIPTSTFLPRQDAEQHPCSSFPSAFGSLTSGPTIDTAPMSRCNSNLNDGASISNQFNEMVRIQSQHSVASCRPSPIATQPPPLLGKRASEDSGIIVMQGGAFSYAYPTAAPSQPTVPGHQHPMQPSLSQSSMHSAVSSMAPSPQEASVQYSAGHLDMERSVSHDSIKSNSSLKFRAKEALARQNYAAKSRHLQPKPATGSADDDDTAEAALNNNKDGKAAIAKTKYERPKHPKVLCNQCTDHVEGFRGEHELRRHTEAKHKSMVKKWICRDPALHGIPHNETAVKPLHECKQCSQNKQYGAYYNAAAHLRRTHFKVKPRKSVAGPANGKNGGQPIKVEEEREKRGGKGGGDWPPMTELKQWMVEITVPMDQAGALLADGVESIGNNMDVEPEGLGPEFADASFRRYSNGAGLTVTAAARGHPMRMMTADGFDATAAFAGMGEAFGGQTIDLATFHGDLDAHLAEMYRNTNNGDGNSNSVPTMFTQPPMPAPLPGMPLSSSGFDYRAGAVENTNGAGGQPLQQQNSITASIAGLDGNSQGSSQGQGNGHGYTSPVSSTATVTQASMYMDQLLPPANLKAPRDDDVPDMPFDLTFTAMGQ